MMNLYYLSGAIAISAVLAVWFHYQEAGPGLYLFKPLTTILIILIPVLFGGQISLYGGLILAGLGFSLLGDVFLMLPNDRFLAGLAAFFLAHLVYITAFAANLRDLFWEPALPIFGLAVLAVILLTPYLDRMKVPVYLYIEVISVMTWMAWSRWQGEPCIESLLAACGAVLFMVSDLILALDRFRSKFKSSRALNLMTYYAAQWLIALSVVSLF